MEPYTLYIKLKVEEMERARPRVKEGSLIFEKKKILISMYFLKDL